MRVLEKLMLIGNIMFKFEWEKSDLEKFRDKYNLEHKYCPKCGSDRHFQTLANYGVDLEFPEKYKDFNRVDCCDCNWVGIVHDLVSNK